MPRYFADADQVMDYESRVVHCMVTLQGFDYATVTKSSVFGYRSAADRYRSAGRLRCRAVARRAGEYSASAPEGEGFLRPRQAAVLHARRPVRFFVRKLPRNNRAANPAAGSAEHRQRNKEDAQRAFTTWPAYRVSQGTLRTMQWRLNDCFRQQRWPDLVFGSPASVDLITFLGVNANGAKMDSPSIKR